MKELRNFNEIFRKDVTYDNIQSHKKTGFHPLFRRYIFGRATGRSQIDHPPSPPSHPIPAAFLRLEGSKVPTSKKRKV